MDELFFWSQLVDLSAIFLGDNFGRGKPECLIVRDGRDSVFSIVGEKISSAISGGSWSGFVRSADAPTFCD